MHKQPRKFILIAFKAEQYAKANVVYAAFHGPIHGLGMVIVIMLGAGGVQLKIAGLVVRFLEKYICAYTRILQLAIVFNRGRGDIHVNAANVPVFVMHGVYGLYAVQYIFYWVVYGVLARFYGKALWPMS